MRKEPLVTGECYHIYNRGVDKRDIFDSIEDVERFKESIKQFNQVEAIGSLEMHNKSVRALDSHSKMFKTEPLISIVAFCVNPNHFHFILKQVVDGGISKFMQKILGGYTYFFNQKYQRSGSLLQGTFKSKLISDENYFRKIFSYVNQNYQVHDIPKNKMYLVFASDKEYENEVFDFVSKTEAEEVLEMFDNKKDFNKHCAEIIAIICEERGKLSLSEPDELP